MIPNMGPRATTSKETFRKLLCKVPRFETPCTMKCSSNLCLQTRRSSGFADDNTVVIMAKYWKEVTQMTNQTAATIHRWLSTRDPQLADHETEAPLVTSRKIVKTNTPTAGGYDISS